MSPKSIPVQSNLNAEQKIEFLFREYYAQLCRDVNKLLRDESLSEDLVQEVFIKVWEKKNHVEVDDRFIFYLKRSCYHAALKSLSSKSYRLETETDTNVSTTDKTDDQMLATELDIKIKSAIANLPEKTQLVFTLSRYEELSYKEIALQMGLSIKAIEKHMGKALKLLKSALNEHLLSLLILSDYFLWKKSPFEVGLSTI